jgi:phage I-like protein
MRENIIENLSCLSNEFSIQADWLKIPYGDHPHYTGAVQRLTRAIAENLANEFNSFGARLGRLFGGLPIFVGHPDDPKLANQYPDKKSYGWIMEMEAREDGLYIKPKWSDAGKEIIANAFYKWFSPLWGCADLAREAGKRIVAPARLLSLGLTNNPVIEGILPLANEEKSEVSSQKSESDINPDSQNQNERKIMKGKLITLFGLSNEATEEQILAAATGQKSEIENLKSLVSAAQTKIGNTETALANEKTSSAAKDSEIGNLKSQIANRQSEIQVERRARIDLVLDNAIAAGKITAAQRPQWASELEQNFDAKLLELSNAKPVLNTASKTQGLGARNSEAHAAGEVRIRQDKLITLVNERMSKTGEDYETAFANIKRTKEGAALLAEMVQPQKK